MGEADANLRLVESPVFMYTNNVLDNCTLFMVEIKVSNSGMSLDELFLGDPYSMLRDTGLEIKVSVSAVGVCSDT